MKIIRRGYLKYVTFLFGFGIFYFILQGRMIGLHKNKTSDQLDYQQYFPDSGAREVSEKRFWGSRVHLSDELKREGLGEKGVAAHMSGFDPVEKERLWDLNGFNALLSDQISLDRSLKDIRNPKCKEFRYNALLPTVSVVIPFFEEHFSTLLRTVVSVVNRSPPDLLKEIILVDDGTTVKEELKGPLDNWLKLHQPKARVIRLPERVGLILARQEGVKSASGDVIVVLDSHCEVMTGWLPPLLEPIVENPRTAVCPLIDVINSDNFAYYPQDDGGRGAFDWRLFYKRLPLRTSDIANLPRPFENPVMNGGLFAINRKFFWELGGYDGGLKIWGGEQYNLSFKIWQCGGRLLDAPCSRVGHLFRQGGKKRPAAKNAGDFLSKNYKRVAVVWMDEYAEALYKRNAHLKTVDAGDVSQEIEVRNRLQCKPFKWFLETIAPDLLKEYPPVEPPDYANGTIKSEALPSHCFDTGGKESGEVILYGCHGFGVQYFSLGWKKNLEVENEQFCIASPRARDKAPIIEHCQKNPTSSQIWRYDPVTHQLTEKASGLCVDLNVDARKIFMNSCDTSSETQRWLFKNVDADRISKLYPFI